MGDSDSVLVNASTWGLMLTGKLVSLDDDTRRDVRGAFKRLVGRVGEPVIRLAVRQAMRIMGHQFVMGRTIDEALGRSRKGDNADYRYSFDMLGEARADRDRCRRATSRHTATRSTRSAGSAAPVQHGCLRRAAHLGQAVRAASALRTRQARARDGRTGAARARTGAAGEVVRHRLHRRCRGSRPPGTVAGRDRGDVFATPRSTAGTASAWPCRPTRSARRT